MDNLVTIDLGKLNREKPTDLIIAKDGSLALEAENELKKILAIQDLVDRMLDYVKGRLQEEMTARKLIKVKASNLSVSRRVFGSRFQINENTPEEFTELVSYSKPNTTAIESFLESQGVLPEGVSLRNREEKISITKREENV